MRRILVADLRSPGDLIAALPSTVRNAVVVVAAALYPPTFDDTTVLVPIPSPQFVQESTTELLHRVLDAMPRGCDADLAVVVVGSGPDSAPCPHRAALAA